MISKADVEAVEGMLDSSAESPDVDWKKLNREATFKQNYTARSTGIQDILGDMLSTFTDNRADAVAAENKTASDHKTLMRSKKNELATAKQALLDKSDEKAARAVAKGEAETEKTDLEGQNSRDETFIDDTKDACETRATEWAERRRLRHEEKTSISTAINTLAGDDARDLFSKREKRATSFLQVSI